MDFNINEHVESDMEDFYKLGYQMVKEQPKRRVEMATENLDEFREELQSFLKSQQNKSIKIARTEDGTFAGYLWIAEVDRPDLNEFKPIAWIYDIVVHPDHREEGLGGRLLEEGEEWARENDIQKVSFHVFADNEPAINLYEKHGYRLMSAFYGNKIGELEEIDSEFTIRERKDDAWDMLFQEGFQAIKDELLSDPTIDFTEEELKAKYRESIQRYDFSKPNLVLFTAEKDGLAGIMFCFIPKDQEMAILKEMYIRPEYSDMGLKEQFIHKSEEWAKENDIDEMRVFVRTQQEALKEQCQKMGYSKENLFYEKII